MSDWDEIKKLAADFQQAQTNETLNRISERNVVDIVKKLIELKLINVIFSTDGKEFITIDHLSKEIQDEVYANGGRIHLSELSAILKVDHQHIIRTANDLVKDKPDEYYIVLGQLIHSSYKYNLAEQIENWVVAHEQLSIADFAKKLDLSTDFLLDFVKDILPEIVDEFVVSADGHTFYTGNLIARYKSSVVGALSAIFKPTNLNSVIKRLDIPEKIFLSLVDESIKQGRIKAVLDDHLFTPHIYIRRQNEYIDKFFESNYYIEYDMLTRLDIKQPKAFLKRRYPQGLALDTCFVAQELITQIEGLVESVIPTGGWIDIAAVIPPTIQPEDIELILRNLFKKENALNAQCLIFGQTVVCSKAFIESCRNQLSKRMQDKASEDLKQGKLMTHFLGTVAQKENDEVKNLEEGKSSVEHPAEATEKQAEILDSKDSENQSEDTKNDKKKGKDKKTGGGYTGREVKQKAVKKKYIPGNKQAISKTNEQQEEGTKAPRSNKGRAARRAISPERPTNLSKGSNTPKSVEKRETLKFMTSKEIESQLRIEMRGDFDFPDDFLSSLADSIEDELDTHYEKVAKAALDDYIAKSSQEEGDGQEIEVVQ